MSKPTLGYWSIRGRAEQCRMLLHHLGIEFEDKQWRLEEAASPEGWFANKHSLGMKFPNLPYWQEDDIFHSGAMPVLRSICRKYKPEYLGRNQIEQAATDSIVDVIYPQVDPWLGTYFMAPDYADKIEEGCEKMREVLGQIMAAKGNNWFLCGQEPTYADFMVNWLISVFILYDEETVNEFPVILQYHNAYKTLSGIDAGERAMSQMLYFPPNAGWQADNIP